MRKLKLFLACLLMAVLSIGQMWAAEEDVDLSAGTFANGTITWVAASNGITITQTKAASTTNVNSSYVAAPRIYKGQILSFEASGTCKITQIDIVYDGSNKGGTITAGVAISENTVTDNTSAISRTLGTANGGTHTFSSVDEGGLSAIYIQNPANASAQLRPTKITITYVGGSSKTLTAVTVSGAPTKTSYYAGQDFDPAGLTVTGTYSDESTAPITSGITWSYDPSQALALNQTSIGVIATVSEISSPKFNVTGLTVTEAPAAVNYELVTNVNDLADAAEIIIVNIDEDKAISTTQASSNRTATAVSSTSHVIAAGDDVQVITLEASSSNWKLSVGEDSYLYASSNSSNQLKTAKATTAGDNGVWAITIANDGAATLIAQGTNGRNNMRYNPNNGSAMFSCYASTSDLGLVKIFKKVDGTVKPSAELSYDAADQKKLAKLGDAFTAPTLVNPHTIAVTYASNNTDVAEVAANGAVTIKAAGVAVITASFAGNDDYKAGSASYTIYVATEAGTAEDPLTEASAKALIDLGCEMEVHVHGTVLGSQDATKFTVTLADGFQFYKLKDLGNVAFKSAYIKNGDEVTAVGTLTKYNTTYELAEGCYLTAYTEYTEPLVDISNTKETAYTVAQALALATNPTSDLTKAVYITGVVYDVKSFNSTNGTLDIYIKDEGVENKFEFYKCAGIYDESLTAFTAADDVQVGDEVIGYGVMTYYSSGSIWEFGQPNQLVSLNRPEVAVTGVELNKESTSLEVGETETLVATVAPANATNKAVTWASDDETVATVDENGVVTAVAGGTTTITVTTADGSFTDDCEVTVTAADPTVHHVTFIAGTDQSDETSITKDGITISASTFNNASYYQCYSGAAMTVSSTVGNITKIELTCTTEGTAKYGPGNWDFTGYSYSGANGSWTGSAETVEFGNASQQVRMTLITVTYKEDNREAAGLAWNPAGDIELTVGDALTAPALLNPNSIDAAEITIESSNTDLATVSEGVVSLVADATGTTTITATFAGNDDYKPATISYNITVNEAGLDNVTFDSSEDHAESGETTITKGGFTLSFTSGSMDGTQAEYRLYKSQTMTLSSTDYLIKKIEFTCTSGNPITGFADATGLDKDNNEWTGESNTVELTASNAQVRMTKIKVFYVEDTRAAAGLAWNPAGDIELTVGDALTAPALLNPNSIDAAEITIESSNTDLATVSEGVVSLVADATGTTTITATFAGNDDFKPATVSYKITVNPAHSIYVSPSLNVNFGSVNQNAEVADKSITVTLTGVDAATLTLAGAGASAFTISPAAALTASGDVTISASSANIGTFAATLTISDDAGNAESKVVNISITVNEVVTPETPVSTTSKWVPATAIEDGMEVLITGVKSDVTYAMGAASSNGNNRTSVAGLLDEGVFTPGENTMPFTLVATGVANTYYIKTSNNQYIYNASTSSKSYLRTKAEQEEVSWTITLDGDNNAVITSVENNDRQIMRFNPNGGNDPLFNCYASGQNDIKLYVPQTPAPVYETVRTGLECGRHYTVCLAKNITHIEGATFWNLTYRNYAGTEAYLVGEDAPEAGKPYIFQATAETLRVVYGEETAGAPVDNGALRGTFSKMLASDLNAINVGVNKVYMLFNNELRPIGTNNHLDANRAYVLYNELQPVNAAPQIPGKKVKRMPMQGQTTTGCELINAAEAPAKMMINGQLFILRGEKMYDTTGRLVK